MSATTTTTLYRAYDNTGALLYIGVSGNLKKRKAAHRRSSEWHPDAVRWAEEAYADRVAALAAELAAIRSEKPLFNSTGADHVDCAHPGCVRRRAEEAARQAAYIERLVQQAPPLTETQLAKLAALLRSAKRGAAE